MDSNTLFLLIVGLACPIGMGLMMWLMNRQMSHHAEPLSSDKQKRLSPANRLAALHEERRILEAEIAEFSHEVELDERPPLTLPDPPSAPEDAPLSAAR